MTCIIGPCCVIDIDKLEDEIIMLEGAGVENVRRNLKISFNAHIIFDKHIQDDIANDMSGSTHCGIRPVYRDKYDRCGTRAEKFDDICGCEIVNPFDFLCGSNVKVLFCRVRRDLCWILIGDIIHMLHHRIVTSGMISSCGFPFKRVVNV